MTSLVDLGHHGDADLAPDLIDLAVNVRPGPPPDWLTAAVLCACARLDGYPDPRAATEAVAARHHRDTAEVLLTAGAAEAFTLIAHGLPRGHAAVVHPQFTEPEAALRAADWLVTRVLTEPGSPLRAADIPEDCSLVVVGNPTNPTGTLHPRGVLTALRRPGRIVVVDEAFMDAVPGEPEGLADAADLTGVLVVRSLTKTWGLAGLRVGYLLGDPRAVAACARVQPRWSVSAPALAAAVACSTPDAVAQAADHAHALTAAREKLRAHLTGRGFACVPDSVGPFLLTRHPERPALHTELRARGIAVRRAETFPGLGPGWIRVSVRDDETTALLLDALDTPGDTRRVRRAGSVTLVGGGPGQDGRITVDGLLALQRADVVVTDHLAPRGLLAHLPPHVTVVDAAKHPRGPAVPQETINQLLVDHARAGARVVRLKGGDPFVFGRGFEEIEACAEAGVPVEVRPGVSSAIAGPAAAGIPVTHRGLTQGFTVVSGHLPPGHPGSTVDWSALARAGTTLVVLMGVATLPAITAALQDAGLAAGTPAAVVADAGHRGQRHLRSTLAEVAAAAETAGIRPPAVTVIGTVAALRPERR